MLANLKLAISARNMRQADLAAHLGVTQSTISEIINGRRRTSPSLCARLAEMLQADEAWLFSSFTQIPHRTDSATEPSVQAACVGETT